MMSLCTMKTFHVERVRREYDIILNPDTIKFVENEVNCVGFKINAEGINTDPDKLKAIAEFPKLTCLTELQSSFMGLINQLSDFTTVVSTIADPFRELL